MAYGLEKIASPHSRIYKQLEEFYKFQEGNKGLSTNSLRAKVATVNNFINFAGVKDVRKITNDHLDGWILEMSKRKNSASTINVRVCHVRTMIEWQREENIRIPGLKLSRIEKKKEKDPEDKRHYYEEAEIRKVLTMADRREWLMIKIGFDTGMRISELRNLRLSDIRGKKIIARAKGGKRRFWAIDDDTRVRLDDYIAREKTVDYLWTSPINKNGPITDNAMRTAMEKPFAEAGMSEFTPHDLRRSFAVDLLHKGFTMREIQHAMGHASVKTTEKYLEKLCGHQIIDIYERRFKKASHDLR